MSSFVDLLIKFNAHFILHGVISFDIWVGLDWLIFAWFWLLLDLHCWIYVKFNLAFHWIFSFHLIVWLTLLSLLSSLRLILTLISCILQLLRLLFSSHQIADSSVLGYDWDVRIRICGCSAIVTLPNLSIHEFISPSLNPFIMVLLAAIILERWIVMGHILAYVIILKWLLNAILVVHQDIVFSIVTAVAISYWRFVISIYLLIHCNMLGSGSGCSRYLLGSRKGCSRRNFVYFHIAILVSPQINVWKYSLRFLGVVVWRVVTNIMFGWILSPS